MKKQDLKPLPLYPADFPASPSPPQDSEGALRMNATCGRKCAASLPNCGPVECLGKMLLALSIGGSTKRSLTWQKRDTLFSHSYFRLAASAHGMSVSELLSSRLMFPTPLASDKNTGQPGCVPLRQRNIPQGEQERRDLEPQPVGGGILSDPGSIGGLPLHAETGGVSQQCSVCQPVIPSDLAGAADIRNGGAEPGLGGMAHGLPPEMDGRILWAAEPEGVPRITENTADRALRLKTLGNAVCPP